VKVLVVDDDPDQLQVRCLLLERNGFETFQAGDPATAMDTVRRNKPACAVMDLRLPDEQTGVQLIRDLRAIDAQLRIIVFTGASTARLASYPELRLVDDIVQKSSGFSSLIKKLKSPTAADAPVTRRSTSKS
jgi:DNA-binding response OmpR family regulator